MTRTRLAIDPIRLRSLLAGINAFGRNPDTGGYNRIGFSGADMAVRSWIADTMRAEGLVVSTDAAGNVFGRHGPAEGPSVYIGSHLDTVPEGGAFDGALGVAVALECVRAVREGGLPLRSAITIVATAEEEGRFGGMLGSQAIAGLVTPAWLASATDAEGVRLIDAMRAAGLEPDEIASAARTRDDVSAFLELHIEQGPVLEAADLSVGIVETVSGVCHLQVRYEGAANHSGTTPMDMRADAFAGVAAVAHAVPAVISESGSAQSRITIGKVELSPNFPHTIPGVAEFTVVIRDADPGIMERLEARMRSLVAEAAETHNLQASVEERSRLAPTVLDRGLVTLMQEEAARLGVASIVMPSGAGHDAQTMQALCPSALVFVPSRGGVSHAPQEDTSWESIETAANLMLAALVRLAT